MANKENTDLSTLMKSSSSSTTSSVELKQEVEPVEVTLPLNSDNDVQSEVPKSDGNGTETSENKPLLEDLNLNPHHNAQVECAECTCDRTETQNNVGEGVSDSKVKLCKNCSRKNESGATTDHTEVNSIPNDLEPSNATTGSKELLNLEASQSEEPPKDSSSILNMTLGKQTLNHYIMSSFSDSDYLAKADFLISEVTFSCDKLTYKCAISDSEDIEPIMTQPLPMTATVSNYCPPGLEDLLEVCQLVIHKSNFRKNVGKIQTVNVRDKVLAKYSCCFGFIFPLPSYNYTCNVHQVCICVKKIPM